MTWATDHIFVAGGDFVSDYWSEFQGQAGVSAVVTLCPDRPRLYVDPTPWAVLWLPVSDENAYTLDRLTLGVDFIETALAHGRKVLLHGPQGVHRTRPLVAAHLIANGKTVARTIRDLEQKPWLPPYHGSVDLLDAFAAWLRE